MFSSEFSPEVFSPHVLFEDFASIRLPGEPKELPRGQKANRTRMRRFILDAARVKGGDRYLVQRPGTKVCMGITFEALVDVTTTAREGEVEGISKASLPILEALITERQDITPKTLTEIAQIALEAQPQI